MNYFSRLFSHAFEISDEHQLTSWVFMRLLAVIYLIAFLSLAVQIPGLVGPNGILPLQEHLDYVFDTFGYLAFLRLPTVFWLNAGDFALQAVAYAGCLFSVALLFGYGERKILVILFFLYLSLFHAGQTFLTFQWDTLLLEAGFLAIFLTAGPTHLLIFLFHWLLFRLRFMSGVAKLLTDDPSWANFTTLDYYFETQPLPHIGSWYFQQLPHWLHHAGVGFVFFTELVVPFFIFLPRKFRLFAAAMTLLMQLLIIASSNHNWINLLTIVLCLFLLDDAILKKMVPAFLRPQHFRAYSKSRITYTLPVFAVLIIFSSLTVFSNIAIGDRVPATLRQTADIIRSWGIGHAYHVYPTMQTERQELQVEGSYDGKEWKAYEFKYKPGPLAKAPVFNVPHQPRLDWMMWFVPPRSDEFMYFYSRFLEKLEQGSPQVLDLLEYNPFPDKPPTYTRTQAYLYKFTNFEEKEKTGNWWKYEYLGIFPYVRPRRP